MKIVFSMTEEELIRGCANNERLAQKRLYERCYSKMFGVCMRYAAGKDMATEILNLGFLKVFENIREFQKKGGNLEGWIYRIMVNTAIDFLRSEMRHMHSEIEKSVYAEDDSNVIAAMGAEQILQMVNELTPAYRAVFNLYVVEGYSHHEIAGMLRISEGTSKSNLAKARARLQEKIIQMNEIKLGAYGK